MVRSLFTYIFCSALFAGGFISLALLAQGQTVEWALQQAHLFLIPGVVWSIVVLFVKLLLEPNFASWHIPKIVTADKEKALKIWLWVLKVVSTSFFILATWLYFAFLLNEEQYSEVLIYVILYIVILLPFVCLFGVQAVLVRLARKKGKLQSTQETIIATTTAAVEKRTLGILMRVGSWFFTFIVWWLSPITRWWKKIKVSKSFRQAHYVSVAGLLVISSLYGLWVIAQPVQLSPAERANDYELVRDTVPLEGPIIVKLPVDETKFGARFNVTFDPQIKSWWGRATSSEHIVFRLREPLEENNFYTISYELADGTVLSKQFRAVQRPRVDIFQPADGTQNVQEDTILTFTFNRPMIPLQSLDRTYATDLPIEITPPTEGDFVWVSQRQLEFIPTKRLTRSSNYTVNLRDGLNSVDGLQVPPQTYSFTVNPLQVTSPGSRSVRAQDPIIFRFNQPVAIDDLIPEVLDENGQIVPTRMEYADSYTYNPDLEQKERVIDRSQVLLWPRDITDRWDFGQEYRYTLKNIKPLEGELAVADLAGQVTVQNLFTRATAVSERSRFVTPDYFDTAGSLQLQFTQPVDVDLVAVQAKGVSAVNYKRMCPASNPNCGEFDPTVLEVSFVDEVFGYGEEFTLSVSDLHDESGKLIGDFTFTIDLKTVDQLEVTHVIPAPDAENRELTICSTNPLIAYDSDTYNDLISTLQPVDAFYSTRASQFVALGREGMFSQPDCAGNYKTQVRYLLAFDEQYDMQITPQDVFGGTALYEVRFDTPAEPTRANVDLSKPWLDNLHMAYSVTSPEKTKYTYVTDNLDFVELTICKVSPLRMLELGNALDRGSQSPNGCLEKQTHTIQIADTQGPDYFQIDLQNYFTQTLGHYIITITHPDLTYTRYVDGNPVHHQFYDHMYSTVTNLSLVEKRTNQIDLTSNGIRNRKTNLLRSEEETNLYWVTDHRTLEPIPNATVSVYRDVDTSSGRDLTPGASAVTDSEGIALTKVVPDVAGAFVSVGQDSALVSAWADVIGRASQAVEIERVYTYTDRPIYRPGDEVFLKGIHRIGYDAEYEIVQNRNLTLIMRDARRNIIVEKTVNLNSYGTFADAVNLDADAPLGTYYIEVKDNARQVGSASFSVEEYTPSPFEVIAESDLDEYIAGDTLAVDIKAQYFFGAPVAEGSVSYVITTQDYFFDKSEDPRFRFGLNWYGCFYCYAQNTFVKRGELVLDGGEATLEELLDFDVLFEDEDDRTSSKLLVLNATVKDGNGRSVSTQKSFIVHQAERYVAVRTTNYFSEVNDLSTVQIKTVDTDGVGQSEVVVVQILKPEWKEFKRREVDGSFYTHSEEEIVELYTQTISTDGTGFAAFEYTFPETGRYTIQVTGTDARGNQYVGERYQYVYGEGTASVRNTNDRSLDISVQDTDLRIGESSKLIIQSPYETAKALVTVERGRVMEYEIIDVDANFFDYDFVATEAHAPNVNTSIVLLSSQPEIKFGQVTFTVDKKVHELDIKVTSNKQTYLPGEEVTLSVETKNTNGIPVPAEVSIAAVDLSVLALKGNPERDPLDYFFGFMAHNIITSSNLKFVHEEIEIPSGTKGGGGAADDLAKRERGVFKDTAFWGAAVVTDATGRATVRFTLPDNLTRWRVETIGVTKDTKVGVDYMEFEEKKDLITLPLLPRFVVPGDKLSLGAEILNGTDVPQTVTFTIESDTLVSDNFAQTVTIPAEGSQTVFVEVESPRSMVGGTHSVLFKSTNGEFEDAVRKPIPIVENTLYETVFLSGLTNGSQVDETFITPTDIHADSGGVRVEAYSTVGAYLEDSVNYMAAYPYGCSEQLASRIATLATVRYLTALENLGPEYALETINFQGRKYSVDEAINTGLSRMYESQNADGGFGYYPNRQSDVSLSLHVLAVLLQLDAVGVDVNARNMERALLFAETVADQSSNKDSVVDRTHNTDALFAKVYLLRQIEPRPRSVDAGISAIRELVTRENVRQFSTHSLVHAALLSDKLFWWDRRTVWAEIDRRQKESTEGLYISKSPVSFAKSFYETDIKNTALLLRAIIETNTNVSDAPKIISWLLARRSDDGAWSTTNATHEVVQTLTQYIDWKNENKVEVTIAMLLDGEQVTTHNSATEPRLEGLSATFTYEELGLDTEHRLSFTQTEDESLDSTMYYDVAMKYYLDREVTPARDEGVQVTREFFALEDVNKQEPLTTATVGDTIVGRVTFTAGSPMRMMALEDKIPAGFEIINFDYSTENKQVLDAAIRAAAQRAKADEFDVAGFMETAEYAELPAVTVFKDDKDTFKPNRRQYVRDFNTAVEELHDDRIFLFDESVAPGTYQYEYYLRALVPGTFQHLPVWVGEMYNPSFFGRAKSAKFTVEP